MDRLKIAQIVPYIGDEASGPAYSVPALCTALQNNGCTVTLYTLNPTPNKKYNFITKGFKRSKFPTYSFGRSAEMYKQLLEDSEDIDIIHNHSFWMAPNIYAGFIAKKKNIPLINAPRGTMSQKALSMSKLKKQIVLKLGQQLAINQTVCFHATAVHETKDIKKQYPQKAIAQLPNGVDVPVLSKETSLNQERNKLLFFGRLHSIKGIENLINAWGNLESQFPNWDLDIIGVGDTNYVGSLHVIIKNKKLNRVSILDPVYGDDKMIVYQNADLYVLPSFSENFGMTVAEALANNTPVITTNQTPWKDLDKNNAGWSIDVGVDALEKVLAIALSKSKNELFDMGTNGRQWMMEKFSWDSIAKEMIATYKWILKKGNKPKCVKT